MDRRGITPVVAIALLLGMTVAASGGAYTFVSQAQQGAQEDASTALATQVEVRDLRCEDAEVEVALKNSGDTDLTGSTLDAYLYRDGDLVTTAEADLSGEDMVQADGLSIFSLPFVLDPGAAYTVEFRVPADDVSVESSCQARVQNLAGYWDFETKQPGTVTDTARGNDGTFQNNEKDGTLTGFDFDARDGWVDGVQGSNALRFDAANGNIRTAEPLAYQGDVTMLAWIRPNTSDPDWDSSPSRRDLFQDDVVELDQKVNNNMAIIVNGVGVGDVNDHTYDYPEGEWSLTGFRYDGATLEMVRDGDIIDSAPLGSLPAPTGDGWFGSEPGGGRYWAGDMDTFVVYNRSLSDAELSAVHDGRRINRSDLVGEWTFDEGNGTTAHDTSKWVDGKVGDYALDFDGTDDHVALGTDPSLAPTEQITVSAWAFTRPKDGERSAVYGRGEHFMGNEGVAVWDDGAGNLDFRLGDGTDQTVATDSVPGYGEWHHVAGTWNGSTMALFVDGTAQHQTSFTGPVQYDTDGEQGAFLGRRSFNDDYHLNGTLDDIRIYDTALTADQVAALYNATQ